MTVTFRHLFENVFIPSYPRQPPVCPNCLSVAVSYNFDRLAAGGSDHANPSYPWGPGGEDTARGTLMGGGVGGACRGRKCRPLRISSEQPCFTPCSLLCRGMNGMAFLGRAFASIEAFLSLGGPASLELGFFLTSLRAGILGNMLEHTIIFSLFYERHIH